MVYTQYCPMSVFIYSSSLLAPFRFRWFHLQTSEMVLLMTITIADVVFYWVIVLQTVSSYEFVVFCVSLLLTPSHYRWFHLVPGSYSSFQVVPARSR